MPRALTDIAIRNLRPEPKRREIPDPGARGLYVIVQPSGVKSFAVRYRYAGVSRKVTLQSGISLAAARKATADALYELERGHDPVPVWLDSMLGRRSGWRHRTRSRPSPRSTKNGKAAACVAPNGAKGCSSA